MAELVCRGVFLTKVTVGAGRFYRTMLRGTQSLSNIYRIGMIVLRSMDH
jgi:hypothetical protein